MKLPVLSVKRRVSVTMLTVLVIILGLVAFTELGFEMLPDLDYPTISIVTTYNGASSQDIEETITEPIETAIAGVKNVKSVSSQSMEDVSTIMVECEWGTNLDFAAQDLRDAIEMILDYLPEDASRPMVMKFNLSQMPVLFYGVTGGESTYKLRKLIEDEISSKLKHLDGVASIYVYGGEELQKQVVIDKIKLDEMGLSYNDLVQVLYAQNLNKSAGDIEKNQDQYLLRILGQYKSKQEIENTPISMTKSGDVVYLKDIARVRDGYKEKKYYTRTDLKPTVMMMVSKESGANTKTVSDLVSNKVDEIEKNSEGDLKFVEVFDQGYMVSNISDSTVSNLLVGGLLAILIMYLFLRNWRPTFVISLAIPISIITTFAAIYLAGFSLNMMTLGGLALGVGMLVDNAVVVIENIYRHIEMGKKRIEAAKIGASQVGMAITASTLTTISVFLPILFAKGFTGQLVRGLALTVAFSLFSSLFVALTIVPMISSVLFKKKGDRKKKRKDLFSFIRDKYLIVLKWSLHNRGKTVLIVAIILIASLLLTPFLGTEFFPRSDMEMQTIFFRMPIGTSLEATDYVIKQIEEKISNIPEVESVMSLVGPMQEGGASADPTNPSSPNEASIFFRLKNKKNRERTSFQILNGIRKEIPDIEGLQVNVMDMSNQMMGGTESPISVKLFGLDLERLKVLSKRIENKVKNIPGIIDVDNSYKKGKPEFQISINKDKAFQYGLTTAQIANAVKTASYGTQAGVFREGGDEIDIIVRLPEEERNSIKKIKNIQIKSPFGFKVSLDQITNVSVGEGPMVIFRENQTRKVTISANTKGKDLGSAVNQIKESLKDLETNLPTGYFIEYGGSYEDMQEAFTVLFLALLLAILLVYVIMSSLFESFLQPFVIMFTVPLSLIGVIVILFISGTSLSVPAFVGVIILSGIVVNNGIVLIDHTNQLRSEGIEKHKALIKAGADRMRPVLITAITTMGGMFPMAISSGQGAEMRAPMAIAVIGGLLSATVFTLVIIPALYSLVDKISYKEEEK